MKNNLLKTMIAIAVIVATTSLASGCTHSSSSDSSSVITETASLAVEENGLATAPSKDSGYDNVSNPQSDTLSTSLPEVESTSEDSLASILVEDSSADIFTEESLDYIVEESSICESSVVSTIIVSEEESFLNEDNSSNFTAESSIETVDSSTSEDLNPDSSNFRYGICRSNTIVVLESGEKADLAVGQQVSVISINDDTYTIEWYDESAMVDAMAVELFPEGYEPNFTAGRWAGCIG